MSPLHVGLSIYPVLVLLFYGIVTFLAIGFLVYGIRFFKGKLENDKVLMAKLDELIQISREESRRNREV